MSNMSQHFLSAESVLDLVDQRAQQGVGSLLAQETLSVVQEDLVQTVEDVLKQQTVLLHAELRVEQQLLCRTETPKTEDRNSYCPPEAAALITTTKRHR